jgi:hypothetical protein
LLMANLWGSLTGSSSISEACLRDCVWSFAVSLWHNLAKSVNFQVSHFANTNCMFKLARQSQKGDFLLSCDGTARSVCRDLPHASYQAQPYVDVRGPFRQSNFGLSAHSQSFPRCFAEKWLACIIDSMFLASYESCVLHRIAVFADIPLALTT